MSVRFFVAIAAALLAFPAAAQMIQSGQVSRGHGVVAIQGGAPGAATYGDAGSALDGKYTELGITATGTPFCISDAPRSSGNYHQLCLGANALGNGLLSYQNYGTAPPLALDCNINGVLVPNCLTQSPSTGFPLLQNATAFAPTVNFTGAVTAPTDVFVLGSLGAPNTTQNPMMAIEKFSSNTTPSGVNPALYAAIRKETTAGDARFQAAFFEAQDDVGWVPDGIHGINFVEGIRSHAALVNNEQKGSAYGVIAFAGETPGTTHTYLIGTESQVDNNTQNTTIFFQNGQYSGSFVSTSGGSKNPDCGFCVNPFLFQATGGFITGFFVPHAADPTRPNVIDSAFRSDADTIHGINLQFAHPSYSAIMLPNNSPVKGKNFGFTSDFNLLFIGADNQLWLGADPALAGIVMGDSGQTTSVFVKAPGITTQNPGNYVQFAATQGAFATGCGSPSSNHLAILSLNTNGTCNTYVNLASDGTALVGRLQIGSALTNGFNIEGLSTVAAGTGKRFLCIDGATKRVYEGTGASCN